MSNLSPGTRLGPYEIIGALGAGGMGEVYRARDTTLDRDVALKILPESFASDPDRLMRFEREAKALASLNHPNIAQVYGVVPPSGPEAARPHGPAIAMELVEGQTLEEAMRHHVDVRGSNDDGLEWALPIARQIASALESAHDSGIIHRDLKPANIKLRDDGTVKVLDFGLAKAVEGDGSGLRRQDPSPSSMNSPTMTSPALTELGLILGTAAYMSPEQARGRPVDRRADIWAFGVVLYEMLTGRQLFQADTVSDSIAAVLRADIDLTALPPSTPARIRLLLRRCLERDSKKRLRDIGDARLEFDDVVGDDGAAAETPAPARHARAWMAALALASLAAVVGPWIAWTSKPVPERPTRRLEARLTAASRGQLSPDGSRIAFVTNPARMVTVQDLGDGAIRELGQLAGENRGIRWSSDGRHVLVVSGELDGTAFLERSVFSMDAFPVDGGSRRHLIERERILGVAPAPNGQVVVQTSEGLELLSPTGGQPQLLVAVDDLPALSAPFGQAPPLQLVARLPDGSFTFFHRSPEGPRLEHWTGGASETIRVLPPDWGGSVSDYAGGPYLYLEDRSAGAAAFDLYAAAFDPATGRSGGELTLVAERVTDYTASASGDLYYRTVDPEAGTAFDDEVVWVNGRGDVESPVARFRSRPVRDLRISPDHRQLAVLAGRFDDTSEIWVYDLERVSAAPRRVLLEGGAVFLSLLGWMPDSARLVFQRLGSTAPGAFAVPIGGGAATLLLPTPNTNSYLSSSGGTLARYRVEGTGRVDLIPVGPDGQLGDAVRANVPPVVWQQNGPRNLALSPDGRWVVHRATADEQGGRRTVLERFPEGGPPSYALGTGAPVAWSSSGHELFLLTGPDGETVLTRVAVDTVGDITIGPPETLFPLAPLGRGRPPVATIDGQRFLTVRRHPHEDTTPAEPRYWYVQNWPGSVRR